MLPGGARITASLTSDLESVRLHLARDLDARTDVYSLGVLLMCGALLAALVLAAAAVLCWTGCAGGTLSEDERQVDVQGWPVFIGTDIVASVIGPRVAVYVCGHARIDQETGIRTEIMPRREAGLPPYRFIWATPWSQPWIT